MVKQLYQELGSLPEALFTASYSLMEGVLRFVHEQSHLGTEIRLGTFDDYEMLNYLPWPVDSIAQDCQQIARVGFELATALIEQQTLTEFQLQIPATVKWRSRG